MTEENEIKLVAMMAAVLGSADEVGWNPSSNTRIVNEAMDLLNRVISQRLKDAPAIDVSHPPSQSLATSHNRELP